MSHFLSESHSVGYEVIGVGMYTRVSSGNECPLVARVYARV